MSSTGAPFSTAIVHDYITQRGGAERVLASMLRTLPDAELYTSVYYPEGTFPELHHLQDIRTLWMNRVPLLRRRHRLNFPFLAKAFTRLTVDAHVTLCSSSGWAHGVQTTGRKIVYCYTPARWLYQSDQYVGHDRKSIARLPLELLRPSLRQWDSKAAQTADRYLVISRAVQARVEALYRRPATILYPPVPSRSSAIEEVGGLDAGFWLCVSRLLPYKNVRAIVEAFRRIPNEQLIVAGSGPDMAGLVDLGPPNVTFTGSVSEGQLNWLYSRCQALIAASYEDFGLTPLEANSFGKPVAALAWGGFLDTIQPGINGVFFSEPTPLDIREAVYLVKKTEWNPAEIVRVSQEFSEDRFSTELAAIVLEEESIHHAS